MFIDMHGIDSADESTLCFTVCDFWCMYVDKTYTLYTKDTSSKLNKKSFWKKGMLGPAKHVKNISREKIFEYITTAVTAIINTFCLNTTQWSYYCGALY